MATKPLPTHPTAKREWRRRRAALTRSVLAPPPKLTLSEWADRYRVLSRENSAEPGRWSTDRVPYLRGVMDACTEPSIEEVVFMKSAQVAGTEGIINNLVGFHIDQDPAPMLVVQISEGEAEKWSKEKLDPMLRDTPRLRGKVREARGRNSGNTILSKGFAGGHLGIVGANAPSGLRARPRRIVLYDEVDGYPASAGEEGDPISLGRKRTTTFWNRKIIINSTPTIKGVSRIEKAYEASDQRRYYVPCPDCRHMQTLRWQNLKWDKDGEGESRVHRPETAAYMCEGCGVLIEERHKGWMVANGEWRATKPFTGIAGFHISALYSLFDGARWERLVKEFIAAEGDAQLTQVFVNTVLGETYELLTAIADPAQLKKSRCEEYAAEVPAGVGYLTASVDTQDDRLELIVRGWGAKMESWLILHDVLMGDPGEPDVWERLGKALSRSFQHELGALMRIQAAALDTGGHHADSVYRFVADHPGRNFYAVKGAAQPGRPIWPGRASKTKKGKGVPLYLIGSDTAKDRVVLSHLRRAAPGPGYMHFPLRTPEQYFAQLTSESKVRVELPGGQYAYRWMKRKGVPNEALDLECYALVALYSRGRVVYEHLETYVEKVRKEGAEARAAADAGETAEDASPDPAPSRGRQARMPRRNGWVNGWRR